MQYFLIRHVNVRQLNLFSVIETSVSAEKIQKLRPFL